ncbi:ABC transporter permease [Rhodophyticola sp. CCM32]|uniref:ABC transporter permease n=1 Tax=Rhodophyticola sp. CCM32 TaxID=2916397 RepID=UPI00107F1383|nr:ABC transporter permease [Rhodophyticola sp. CCM32]QBY01726.1 ABC transporter permease [Rhodophyticola sp. CCM32]
MIRFIIRRLCVMALSAFCLSLIIFLITNLEPNLRNLAITQTNMRADEAALESWLEKNGYRENTFIRYGMWLGIVAKQPIIDEEAGLPISRFGYCDEVTEPRFSGVLQGDWGCSTKFNQNVSERLGPALISTGILMFWVMIVMVPLALTMGVLSGMREGSRLDRVLSVISIIGTATPEYVSGVVFTVVFASWLGVLNGSAATATSSGVTFHNFTLPVMTMVFFGMGYIARMTRASMAEVMTQQYIRTARLKGVSFTSIVLKHALRNALVTPFTIVMLQFPWLLNGVVIVEVIFRYQGFGYVLVEGATNNDIDLLLACGTISVVLVLTTQLISDIGYVFLNPRIRVS